MNINHVLVVFTRVGQRGITSFNYVYDHDGMELEGKGENQYTTQGFLINLVNPFVKFG